MPEDITTEEDVSGPTREDAIHEAAMEKVRNTITNLPESFENGDPIQDENVRRMNESRDRQIKEHTRDIHIASPDRTLLAEPDEPRLFKKYKVIRKGVEVGNCFVLQPEKSIADLEALVFLANNSKCPITLRLDITEWLTREQFNPKQ